jgi:hypothetical protein
MHLSRRTLIVVFTLTAALWYFGLATDAGNYWHGGTPFGRILTDAAAVLALFALVETYGTSASLSLKVVLSLVAAPLAIYVGLAITYAAKYLLAT